METVRVSSKGQIVIPKRLRTALHIEPGSELSIVAEGEELRLRPTEHQFARTDVAAGFGLLAKPGRKAPDETEAKQIVGAMLMRKNAVR